MQIVQSAWNNLNPNRLRLLAAGATQLHFAGHALVAKAVSYGKPEADARAARRRVYYNRISKRLPDFLAIATLSTFVGTLHKRAGLLTVSGLGVWCLLAAQTDSSTAKKMYALLIPTTLAISGIPIAEALSNRLQPFGYYVHIALGVGVGLETLALLAVSAQAARS